MAYDNEQDDNITAAIRKSIGQPGMQQDTAQMKVDEPAGGDPISDAIRGSLPPGPTVPGGDPNAGEAPPMADAPTLPDYTKRGKFGTFNMGADDKYNRPWDQLSERYKMQTVLSNFDPNAGITPEVIDALNKANINGATFSGSGDKLDARNLSAWENYDGHEGIGDIIQGFKDPNNKNKTWGAWLPESKGGGGETQVELPIGQGAQPIPYESGGVPTDDGFFAKMLAALRQQAGGASTDRAALMSQMGVR